MAKSGASKAAPKAPKASKAAPKAAKKATKSKVSKEEAGTLGQEVKEAHAATGRPVSPTDDPTDHSVPASQLAAQVDPAKKSGATVNAESMDKVNETAEAKEKADLAEIDNSIVGKIRRSELYAVNDHPNGGGWYVGISPQNDPNASEASKRLSSIQPLDTFAPKTGMRVVPKEGEAFVIPDGFGLDSQPADWARVMRSDGSPLFA